MLLPDHQSTVGMGTDIERLIDDEGNVVSEQKMQNHTAIDQSNSNIFN